jgi:hypothetical protein
MLFRRFFGGRYPVTGLHATICVFFLTLCICLSSHLRAHFSLCLPICHDIDLAVVNILLCSGEPLNCFDYVAWAPSQPRDRLADEDCVALDGNKQWLVSKCSIKLPYLCELWPGGDQPPDNVIRLTKCAELQNPGELMFSFFLPYPMDIRGSLTQGKSGRSVKLIIYIY